MKRPLRLITLVAATLALAACEVRDGAHTQVESPKTAAAGPTFSKGPAPVTAAAVQIIEGGTTRTHTVIGPLKLTVGKLTAFHPNPTRELALERLREEAAKLGANGVINASVSEIQITPFSWGARIATGTAVKF